MIDNVEQSARLQRNLGLVVETGLLLAKGLDLNILVQAVTDAGLQLCGARFGAFFSKGANAAEGVLLHRAFSGANSGGQFPFPRNSMLFAPTFEAGRIVRSDNISDDSNFRRNAHSFGGPPGHFFIRSYLAVPVKTQAGEVLGGLFYGHEQSSVFEREAEALVSLLAAQLARAIDIVRLRAQLSRQVKDLEKAARQANEVAAIVESSDDAILSKDLTGKIMSWNQAASRILGYSRDEIIGKSILTIIPEELHQEEKIILEKIRSGIHIDHYETVRLTKSGERLDVSLSISPVRDASGTIVGASKILRDVSQKKRMEKSLLQAEKIAAVGRMAATIAHEINNPLEAIMNLIYLARNSAGDKEAVTELLSAAESELVRISHIARQTLGFYRENTSAVCCSLSDLVADAVRIYEPRCGTANIRVEKSLKATRQLLLRKGEIMQVISNLLANSIQAMPAGGRLSISTVDVEATGVADAGDAGGVLLTVEDNGTGISPDNLPHIFEAFFTTRRSIGTGIGLFVAKQFVEGHKGKMTAESSVDAVSHGTRITVFLPQESPQMEKP